VRLRSGLLAILPLMALAGCGSSDEDVVAEKCEPAAAVAADPVEPHTPEYDALAPEAVKLLRSDPDVGELIGGRSFEVGRPAPWSTGGHSDAFGFVIPMNFSEPFSVDSDSWPVIISPGAGRPDAETTPRLLCKIHVEGDGITRLQATVNLTEDRVEELASAPLPLNTPADDLRYEDLGPLPEEYRPVPGY
jgi:hypothetical protein